MRVSVRPLSSHTLLPRPADQPNRPPTIYLYSFANKNNTERYFPISHRLCSIPHHCGCLYRVASPLPCLCFASPLTVIYAAPAPPFQPLAPAPAPPTAQAPPWPRCGRQLATEVAAHVLVPEDTDRCHQRKDKRRTLARKSSGLGSCYGYGAPM